LSGGIPSTIASQQLQSLVGGTQMQQQQQQQQPTNLHNANNPNQLPSLIVGSGAAGAVAAVTPTSQVQVPGASISMSAKFIPLFSSYSD